MRKIKRKHTKKMVILFHKESIKMATMSLILKMNMEEQLREM